MAKLLIIQSNEDLCPEKLIQRIRLILTKLKLLWNGKHSKNQIANEKNVSNLKDTFLLLI